MVVAVSGDATARRSNVIIREGEGEGEGGSRPRLVLGDGNGDGGVDISDASFLLNFLFLGGPAPGAPFPGCGELTDGASLSCETPPRACTAR